MSTPPSTTYLPLTQKFKEMVASLFDGMMQEVGLDD